MKRFFGALLLTGALFVPAVQLRADHDKTAKRYYDRDRRDYHEWNEREDRAYRRYLEDRKRQVHEWRKANRNEQRDYWRWRHEHSDDSLWGR